MDDQTTIQSSFGKIDKTLFIVVVLLLCFGLVMVYSASYVKGYVDKDHNPMFFLRRQAMFAGIGFVLMLIASQVNYHLYQKLVYPMIVVAILGLIAVHSPIGETVKGASRWISIPMGSGKLTIQPSEMMKVALILWLSYSLAKKSDKIKSFSIGFLPHLILPGLLILLCLSQPDFGTSVIVATITFSLLFVAGAKLSYLMLALITSAPIVYFLVAGSKYRLQRILTFLDPISNRFQDGYQLSQSLFGFSSGGLWGVGIGDGLQKFLFLPEPQNDFIASIIAEELGVIGIWGLMLLFLILTIRCAVIAMRSKDDFGMYIGVGFTVLFGMQSLINLGVTMGLLPTKGLTLPFISYGGSSLVTSLFAVGILLNISKQPPPLSSKKSETSARRENRQTRRSSVEDKA